MLELLLILGLLIAVPAFAIAVLAGSAAYVEAGAERELEKMAADESVPGPSGHDTGADEQQAAGNGEGSDAAPKDE